MPVYHDPYASLFSEEELRRRAERDKWEYERAQAQYELHKRMAYGMPVDYRQYSTLHHGGVDYSSYTYTQPDEERKTGMHASKYVFLLNDTCRAVMAIYDKDQPHAKCKREMFKTFDPTICVEDYVIVPTNTRHGMTVVQVVEVDVEPDFDDGKEVPWVIGKVTTEDHERLLKQEADAVDKVKAAERRRRRKELRESMLNDAEEEILALPISHVEVHEPPSDPEPEAF